MTERGRGTSEAGTRLGALVAGVLALCACLSTRAAVDHGQGSGLPSLLVQALAIDARGMLWVGTQDGLARYDGHRFETMSLALAGEPDEIQVQRLLAVPGAVFIATDTRVQRFDLASEARHALRHEGRDLDAIHGLVRDRDGWIYAASETGELFRWREEDVRPEVERLELQHDSPLPPIKQLAVGREALWLATGRGVWRVHRGGWHTEPLVLDLPDLADGQVHVSAVTETPDGEVWIGFWNDGLARVVPGGGRVQRLMPGMSEAGALRSTSIYSFHATAEGLAIGTNRGLVLYRRDCDCVRGLNHPDWDAVEGRGFIVTDVASEGDGLWAGAWGTGLVRFSATDQVFERQVRVDGREDSLAHPMVYALHVDAGKRLWIGTYGGGVQWAEAADRVPGERWPLQRVPWGERRSESRLIWALQDAPEGLLIGSGHGLLQWRAPVLSTLDPDLLSTRSLLVLPDARRLVGTMFGLFLVQDGIVSAVELDPQQAGGPSAHAIWSLHARGDEIWVGTGRGLWRLDAADLSVVARHEAGIGASALPGATVWVQKSDAKGRSWLGTSAGLVEVAGDAGAPVFVPHPAASRAGATSIGSIEFDRGGRLWLGSPQGLVSYRPDTGEARRFDARDGLVSDQVNNNASASDGERLYFGGVGGLVAFDPDAMPEPDVALRPQLVRVRLGAGDWRPPPTALTLAHDHPTLHAEMSAFHFARPERVRYAYRWTPLEAGFTELGEARSAVFTRLPAGRHRLELRAMLLDQPRTAVIAEVLRVEVTPAWHRTLAGRVAIAFILLALGYGLLRWRVRAARRLAQDLAREVRERTHELRAAKEALETANLRLQRQVGLDPLTGLENRRRLFEVAGERQCEGRAFVVVLIDLDRFKGINDRHGHHAGDAVLVDFAGVMRAHFAERTICARYGGEEFLALLDEDDAGDLEARVARLLEAVRARRVSINGRQLAYTASAGAARGRAGETLEDVIGRADAALYRAKVGGRDRFEID